MGHIYLESLNMNYINQWFSYFLFSLCTGDKESLTTQQKFWELFSVL